MVYIKVASDDYLAHHGIKGQRWGVRRYQNSDGSLTNAGRKRYSSNTVGSVKDYPSKEEMQRVIKEEKIKKQYDEVTKSKNTKIDDTTNAIRTVNNNLNSLENIYRSSKTKNLDTKIDVSNMTNKELQDAITRMNLEDNYVRLMRSRQPQVQQGKDAVEKTLSVLKTGGELAVSALTIYSLVKKLEHTDIDPIDYLAHHGIKGQRWGVRRYQNLDGSLTNAGRKRYGVGDVKGETANVTEIGYGEEVIADLAFVAIFATAAVVSNKVADNKRTKQFDEQYYGDREIESLEKAPKINPKSMSMSDHMASINPDYPEYGYTNNCMLCTTAMAMRMKGYDVKATSCPSGWTPKNLEANFENAERTKPKLKTTKDIESYLTSQGDGAYGNMIVRWNAGGGHSVFYQVENGKATIYDTQANKQYKVSDYAHKIDNRQTEIIRLDKATPTERVLGALKEVKKENNK